MSVDGLTLSISSSVMTWARGLSRPSISGDRAKSATADGSRRAVCKAFLSLSRDTSRRSSGNTGELIISISTGSMSAIREVSTNRSVTLKCVCAWVAKRAPL